MRLNLVRALIIMTTALPMSGHAARPLGPPIAEFFRTENQIACAAVLEKSGGNKVEARVTDYLYGTDDETVTIMVDESVFADVRVGAEYVFVFSRLRKNRLVRDEWEVNPDGPSLVKVRGLDTPAIYENNAAITALLAPNRGTELSAVSETSMLLELAENENDTRARELAIFELYLRNDLQSAVSADNARRYATITAGADPRLKNFLLQGARMFPQQRRTPWVKREYRNAIANYGIDLDLNSDVPLLVKNALLGLRHEGTPDDLELISKHLYSNAPGVAKAALSALDAIDPQQAMTHAQQAMQTDKIHLVTRRALTIYIEQHSGA